MKDQGFPPRYRGLADLDTQSMGRRMAPSISCECHGCSFWFQLSSTCHCLNMWCQRQLCFQQEGPRGPSWKRERVRTSMWLEHETKPAERERKMTRTQHAVYLCSQQNAGVPRSQQGAAWTRSLLRGVRCLAHQQMMAMAPSQGDKEVVGQSTRMVGGVSPGHDEKHV